MNVYQKIVEVKKVAEGFSKDSKSYGYEYVSGNQILHKIRDKMNELGLLLMPEVESKGFETHQYVNAKGKACIDFVVHGEMRYKWVNADDPSDIAVGSWAYYGQQDDISKAFGSALTYSERYYLLKALGLPTDEDDPDTKPSRNPEDDTKKVKTISEAQAKRLYAIASSKGIKAESVKARVKKDFDKEVLEMTKKEYDDIVARIQAVEVGAQDGQ